MPAVLVTDGEQRAALALVRSLGRQGHPVYVCSSRTVSLAGASRYARAHAKVPAALDDPEGFVSTLRALIREWDVEILIPVSEPSVLSVLEASESFGGVTIPFPPAEAFRRVCDKRLVAEVAQEVGISIPAQHVVRDRDELSALSAEGLHFPLVVKPFRSVADGPLGRVKLNVSYAQDRGQLDQIVRELPTGAFPLLLQQRVVGPGIGVFLLLWNGRRIATFSHKRIREKPPSGGVSVYRESIEADPELVRKSEELLRRFDWRGVAMVEYKLDASTSTPYLMEINGRFWGSLQLAIDAGVDFPALLVEVARGGSASASSAFRAGIRSRWWWGDVDQLLTRLRHSPESLALPPDAPSRARSVADFLKLWRPGDRNEIFRWDDPFPLVRESLDWIRGR